MLLQIILSIIAFIILISITVLVIAPIDFKGVFIPLTPIIKTAEHKLILKDGVMYTTKGKPFNGTTVFKGIIETYPSEITAFNSQNYTNITTHKGKRTTQYVNGLKDGQEKIYYTYRLPMWYGGPTKVRTKLHAEIQYKRGVKNGLEIIYQFDKRSIEANYKDGLLDGIYKEFHMIEVYRKNEFSDGIGHLKLEAEYHKGSIDGFYRTYTQYGDTCENYVMRSGKVIEGRVKTVQDSTNLWQWYKNGNLIEEREFDRSSWGNSIEPPSVENRMGGCLLRETFYDNNEVIEMRLYNTENNKVFLYKKRIKGQLIEIFNRNTGVDRTAEFGLN